MLKRSTLLLFILLILTVSAFTQETYFGKNKVRYKNFDWNYIQTRHFDIYFYENAYPTSKFCAEVMESAYVEIAEELDYVVQKRIPVFIYNSHNDFQQTNITPGFLPEGVGGFTEAFKNRIVIPFTGSYEDFRHVLHHELTHAVIFDMLFGNAFTSLLSRQRLFNLPLWFAEGYAEYSSRHGWDYWSDMYVRDATINSYLAPPDYIGGFLAYKQGQAMVKFIADKYGEKKLGEILRKGKIHLTMNKAIKSALGITMEEFWKEFSKEMKRRYWPEISIRKEAEEIGKRLTNSGKDGSFFNDKPAFSPEGDKIAIFTDRSDYTEIVFISAVDGKKIKTLVKAERSADLESLHWFVSGISFSPDGRKLVFAAKSKGKEALFISESKKKKITLKKRLDFHNIVSPAWSPDGKKIAFSALDGYKRDIYIYHVETDEIEQITDDRFDDVEPSWMQNSSEIIFSSDRPHPQNPTIDHLGQPYVNPGAYMPGDFDYGTYNIFKVETAGLKVTPVDVGPGSNKFPAVSPDGKKVAFISNRNGIDNIYIGYIDSVHYFAVTDILSGVRSISWSPDGDQIAYSAFSKGAFDVFLLKDIMPVGENGVLAETDYLKGKYDLIDPSKKGRLAHHRNPELQKLSDNEDEKKDSTKVNESDTETSSTLVSLTDTLQIDSTTISDTSVAIAAEFDSTATSESVSKDTTEVVSESGIYDDDYVYVADKEEEFSADSLFSEVIDKDSLFNEKFFKENPSFDSIPPRKADGEYKINPYKVKFTPDFVGGGFSYDTFFGVQGQTAFVFSDYLGNHQIYVATDIVNSIDQSFLQGFYLNSTNRTSLGAGLFHTKNFYLDSNDSLFSDRFYGLSGFLSYPFSTFKRVEFTGSQYFIDRKYHDRDPLALDRKRNSKVTVAELAYVFDNVLWGYTGPVNGNRYKLKVESVVNLFDASDIEFYSAEFDYRKYWHFKKTFTMAFRISGGASFGNTPKQYFLGGSTNTITNRTLDAEVFDVENLYFADVVTPLRGERYYDLSGDRYGLINWEFRFPLIQYFIMRYPLPIVFSNIAGAVFTDMGATWTGSNFKGGTSEGGKNRLQDIKTGIGLGMRMNLFGFMLLRYDIAWSTDMNRFADKPRHYFSFGADF